MRVKAGQEGAFEAAWLDVARHAAAAPGNLRQALLRDPRDPTRFVVSTDWTSLETFRSFERSPEQDRVTAPLRALRESAAMAVYEVVHRFEGGDESTSGPE